MRITTPKTTVYTFRDAAGTTLDVIAGPRESAFSALYRYLKGSNLPLDGTYVFVPRARSAGR